MCDYVHGSVSTGDSCDLTYVIQCLYLVMSDSFELVKARSTETASVSITTLEQSSGASLVSFAAYNIASSSAL